MSVAKLLLIDNQIYRNVLHASRRLSSCNCWNKTTSIKWHFTANTPWFIWSLHSVRSADGHILLQHPVHTSAPSADTGRWRRWWPSLSSTSGFSSPYERPAQLRTGHSWPIPRREFRSAADCLWNTHVSEKKFNGGCWVKLCLSLCHPLRYRLHTYLHTNIHNYIYTYIHTHTRQNMTEPFLYV